MTPVGGHPQSPADSRKRRIARSFGAAEGYERRAEAQVHVARTLAAALPEGAFASRPAPLVLEIGCGTGVFSRALAARLPVGARLLCTDLSEAMARRARESLRALRTSASDPPSDPAGRPGAAGRERPGETGGRAARWSAYALVMDAEAPAVRPGFDLIASSMALQWTTDIRATLRGLADLLQPGGLLLVAAPGRESFGRWRAAAERLGLPAGRPLPTLADLAPFSPAEGTVAAWEERFEVRHADALDFFRSLKELGATVPTEGRRPADPAAFRRLLREMDEAGRPFAMDYQALYALFTKGAGGGSVSRDVP